MYYHSAFIIHGNALLKQFFIIYPNLSSLHRTIEEGRKDSNVDVQLMLTNISHCAEIVEQLQKFEEDAINLVSFMVSLISRLLIIFMCMHYVCCCCAYVDAYVWVRRDMPMCEGMCLWMDKNMLYGKTLFEALMTVAYNCYSSYMLFKFHVYIIKSLNPPF